MAVPHQPELEDHTTLQPHSIPARTQQSILNSSQQPILNITELSSLNNTEQFSSHLTEQVTASSAEQYISSSTEQYTSSSPEKYSSSSPEQYTSSSPDHYSSVDPIEHILHHELPNSDYHNRVGDLVHDHVDNVDIVTLDSHLRESHGSEVTHWDNGSHYGTYGVHRNNGFHGTNGTNGTIIEEEKVAIFPHDTMVLVISLFVMIFLALIFRKLCLKLTAVNKRKTMMRDGIKAMGDHMSIVTRAMSHELDLHPDSPKSVIRTYSNYNNKGKSTPPGSPKKSRWSTMTPPSSPKLPAKIIKTLVPPSPNATRKKGMGSDLRMQAMGNSFNKSTIPQIHCEQQADQGEDKQR